MKWAGDIPDTSENCFDENFTTVFLGSQFQVQQRLCEEAGQVFQGTPACLLNDTTPTLLQEY